MVSGKRATPAWASADRGPRGGRRPDRRRSASANGLGSGASAHDVDRSGARDRQRSGGPASMAPGGGLALGISDRILAIELGGPYLLVYRPPGGNLVRRVHLVGSIIDSIAVAG